MSAVEEAKTSKSLPTPAKLRPRVASASMISKTLGLLSSVRFGVFLLILLVIANMIGMLIMQQSVEGFDKYYVELMPSQKLLYGWLGFFDIYHTWYFNLLLLLLSLTLILASIDRFPSAWKFISERKLEASRAYLLKQELHARLSFKSVSRPELVKKITGAFKSAGLKTAVTEKNGRSIIFGERGAFNRLGAYAVHVALLTIFTGFFLTSQFGRTGQMQLMPGTTASQMTQLNYYLDTVTPLPVQLPFVVKCTDIQQKLIKKDGSIQANNTIDWLTRIKITDENGERDALVHLNEPYDYRGYRFFQASFTPSSTARSLTLRLTSEKGGDPFEVTVPRNGSAKLPDGTDIGFANFFPDFQLQGGKAATASDDYNNPAALLKVTSPSGDQRSAYAFQMELPSGAPVGAAVGGYKFRLVDFEKVSLGHVLSIQHDPGRYPFYVGGMLLGLTLAGVFFFSHQRVWAVVLDEKDGNNEVVLGGNTNRNKLGFEDRFKKLMKAIGPTAGEVNNS